MKKLLFIALFCTSFAHEFQIAKSKIIDGQEYITGQLGYELADVGDMAKKTDAFTRPNSKIAFESAYHVYMNTIKPKYTDTAQALEALDLYLKNNKVVGVVDNNNIIVLGEYDGIVGDCETSVDTCAFTVKITTTRGTCDVKSVTCLTRPATDIYTTPAENIRLDGLQEEVN